MPTPLSALTSPYLAMDAELSDLIAKTPENNLHPSREQVVTDAYLKNHPEFEKRPNEVFARYSLVHYKLRKEGKLPEQISLPATNFTPKTFLDLHLQKFDPESFNFLMPLSYSLTIGINIFGSSKEISIEVNF